MIEEKDNKVLQTIRKIKEYGYTKILYYRIISNWFYNRHPEYRNEIEYLRKVKHWAVFPYEFMDHYVKDDYPAYEDKESGYIYVMHDGKPLFFHNEWGGCEEISKMYYYFLQEQNEASPHKYFTKEFYADKDDIMIDVGCAEGMQTLDIIENIKEAYLFEYDEKWIGPLNKTFAPYAEKCHIIKKMVSDKNEGLYVTLDSTIPYGKNIILKIDVEGMEADVLNGAKELIRNSKRVKALVCTYHKSNDYKLLSEMLMNLGFYCKYSNGYMLYSTKQDHPYPFFRRGLIRAIRGEK